MAAMSGGPTCAIVPVKALAQAKRRLAPVLPDAARRRLVLTMLEDVLAAVAEVAASSAWWSSRRTRDVASAGATAAARRRAGARCRRAQRRRGAAASPMRCAHGAGQALVLPADVPLATPAELSQPDRIRGGRRPGVTLAPSHDSDGTNALLLAPPDAIAAVLSGRAASCSTCRRPWRAARCPRAAPAGARPRHRRAGATSPGCRRRPAARYAFLEPVSRRCRAGRGSSRTAERAMTTAAIRSALCGRRDGRALSTRRGAGARRVRRPRRADRARGAALPRRPRHARQLLQEGLHPADASCAATSATTAPSRTRRARGEPAYLSPEAVLEIARAGQAAGCKEALFTLGDQPELRYAAAREALAALGADSTLAYLEASAALVLKETGLLPHLNPGVMDEAWLARLRKVSVSQGIMLETASDRLSQRGGPHFGSPDKVPAVRLATLEAAGRARVPFTTGILIGIGETRAERIEALLAIRDVHERHGHIQEVIIQNFRAKPGTRMAARAEPSLEDHVWTIAVARLIFGPAMNIQAPPNLRPEGLAQLDRAPASTTGAACRRSRPTTSTPRRPGRTSPTWSARRRRAGRTLVERLAIYPEFVIAPRTFAPRGEMRRMSSRAPKSDRRQVLRRSVGSPAHPRRSCRSLRRRDDGATSVARPGAAHTAAAPHGCRGPGAGGRVGAGRRGGAARGAGGARRARATRRHRRRSRASSIASPPAQALDEADIVALFEARGRDFAAVCRAADRLRAARCGDVVTYVVNRNINYTNICTYGCKFCAFSKGRHNLGHRDKPYDLDLERDRATARREAWQRGATEVCLQGGIRPGYTGDTYLAIVDAVKSAAPDIHVHAFSPLEIRHGAETLGLSLCDYLSRAEGCRARQPARHGRRDPRRRGARHPLPRQDQHRAVARGDGDRARRRPAEHRHHHVRPRRRLPALGAPSAARARAAGEDRRLHRVRAAAVRAHGGADLPQGPVAQGADLPRGRADARGGAAGARSASSPTSRPRG